MLILPEAAKRRRQGSSSGGSAMARHVLRGDGGSVLAGIGFALTAYSLFSLHDATIKWLVAGVSVWQVLFVRIAVILPLILVFGDRSTVTRAATSPIRRSCCFVPSSSGRLGSPTTRPPAISHWPSWSRSTSRPP